MSRATAARAWVAAAALCCATAQAQVRPQLDDAAAARHTAAHYLAQGPAPWSPPPPPDAAALRADYTVAADGSGTHRTVQAAIDAVPAAAPGARRWVVKLRPGTYRETVCVRGKAPITLLGDPADASAATIVEGRWNALPKAPDAPAHPCHPDLGATTHGTPGSATMIVASPDFQAAHLTVANDALEAVRNGVGYPAGAGESGGAQGVALTVQADRVTLDDVRLLGHQDTFHVRRPVPDDPARVLVRRSLLAGDVDFIFGSGTLVVADSEIRSRAGRRAPGNGGHVLAPSTPAAAAYGFLVERSRFTAEPGLPPGAHSLGRAWDEGVPRGAWQAGVSPNGQALVRDSRLGVHLAPWAASTSRRPFADYGPAANRMAEHRNEQAGSRDLAREVLPGDGGWAAAGDGTRGGADAAAADVHDVRDRAGLVRALSPHAGRDRPRIVRVHGRVDLAVDDAGRALDEADYRDPALDWDAFERAYDPATWGRKPPEGPLEEARRRSAARQAARVVLRVPSRTTIVGVGGGAALVNGGLLLDKVDDVIVRNLHFADAWDHFPAWDPKDNEHGEWNSEYDNLTLRGATHVWVDHCTFDDGPRPDSSGRERLGRRMQHHDGLLDITHGSNFVTVSWNHFRRHDKTTLVGSGDARRSDDGLLKVTFHHNLWEDVKERAPRVRYGQVHVVNNLYVANAGAAVPYGYSLGVGVGSRIVSERNVWVTPPDVPATRLVRWWKGTTFVDRGSVHNGRPVDLLAALRQAHPEAELSAEVGWQPAHGPTPDDVAEVAEKVRSGAGAGRF